MIVERFPELGQLDPTDQLTLASELAKRAMSAEGLPNLEPESVEQLEKRLDHYLTNPETGTDWEVLRNKDRS